MYKRQHHDYTKRLLADAPSLTLADVGTVSARAALGDREALVRVEGLTQRFGDFIAVDDISFTVAKGSTHALVGESGSGKTTTGRSIAMFNTPTEGSITVGGRDIVGLRGKQLRAERNNIQLVYQNPYGSLDPKQSIGQTVAEPLRNLKGASASTAKALSLIHI